MYIDRFTTQILEENLKSLKTLKNRLKTIPIGIFNPRPYLLIVNIIVHILCLYFHIHIQYLVEEYMGNSPNSQFMNRACVPINQRMKEATKILYLIKFQL